MYQSTMYIILVNSSMLCLRGNTENDERMAPGGGTQVQRGVAPALRISRKKGSFLIPPHVRDFVKEGYFFVLRYEVWGSKSPYNPRNVRGYDAE